MSHTSAMMSHLVYGCFICYSEDKVSQLQAELDSKQTALIEAESLLEHSRQDLVKVKSVRHLTNGQPSVLH